MFFVKKSLLIVLVLSLTACQTTPNTQGAGVGEKYTPVIDMEGIASIERYEKDLDTCRANSRKVDSTAATFGGMMAGMLIGAAIGASFGGNSSLATDGAIFGGGAGMAANGGKAIQKQETIMANCMAGRGYRVLSGATIPASQYVASPYQKAGAQTDVASLAPSQSKPSQKFTIGRSSSTVEDIAREQSCSVMPAGNLIASGAGFENYSVQCDSGDLLMFRCEFGNCRALQ